MKSFVRRKFGRALLSGEKDCGEIPGGQDIRPRGLKPEVI
jgi:hypothetical protein